MRSFIIYLCMASLMYAQTGRMEISGAFCYTTSAQLFLNPKSFDPAIRNSSVEMTGITGQAVELSYYITDNLKAAVSVAYEHGMVTSIGKYTFALLKQDDGYDMLPVELSVYYLFPFSTEKIKFLMGGGLGYYNSRYFRNIGTAEISTTQVNSDWGIQCSAWGEYSIFNNLSVMVGMKFRDPSNEFKAEFKDQSFYYQGQAVYSTKKSYDAKINADGISFLGGLKYTFRVL